jgi:hypothetical protein
MTCVYVADQHEPKLDELRAVVVQHRCAVVMQHGELDQHDKAAGSFLLRGVLELKEHVTTIIFHADEVRARENAQKATVGRSAAAGRRRPGAHMAPATLERRLARSACLRHPTATASAAASAAAPAAANPAATCTAATCAAELIIRVGVEHDRAAARAAAARLEAASRRARQRRRQRQLVERRPC